MLRVFTAKRGLNLQKEQTLVINAPVEGHDFVTLLTKEAYTMGAAEVVVNWRSDDMTRLRYEYEDLSSFETLPDWRRDFSLHYYHKKSGLPEPHFGQSQTLERHRYQEDLCPAEGP